MKPVYQTKFGKYEGNCFAACLASIFDIPLESIPEFHQPDAYGADPLWYEKFEKYMLGAFNLQPLDLNILKDWKPKGYHFINGKSPRGDYDHSIVGLDGTPVHDPFPNGNCELESQDTYTVFLTILS